MSVLTLLISLAALATLVALGAGIVSMMRGGEFDQQHSTELMLTRVGAQAVAFALLMLALLSHHL